MKETITLSDALRTGERFTHPERCQIRPMLLALKGAGKLPMNIYDPFAFDMKEHLNPYQVVAYPEDAMLRVFPWLKDPVLCPWCASSLKGGQIVEHPAVEHDEEIGNEDVYEWIEDMEAVPDLRTRALAVYFHNPEERLQALEMARMQKMASTHFLAAAARLVIKYHIPLRDFVTTGKI